MLVGHVPELRGERQCVMEAIKEVTDPVAGGRCPLHRSDGEVRRFVEIGGEAFPPRAVAEPPEFRLDVELLSLLHRPDPPTKVADLENEIRADPCGWP